MKLIQGIDVTDPTYDQWCNGTQLAAFEAVRKYGSVNKAAGKLGKSRCSIRDNIRAVKGKAAKAGYSPNHDMVHTAPDGYKLKGTSTLYDKDGKPKLQWVKTKVDEDRQQQMMEEAVDRLTGDIPARVPMVAPKLFDGDLCNMYTFSDHHLATLAWRKEGGADWDIKIATDTLKRAMTDMVTRSPAAGTAIINQLGDFFTYDSMESVTPTNRNILDVDSRPEKMIEAGIECMDYLISQALYRHQQVIVVIAQGNHDLYSSIFLRKMFQRLYRNEPRIRILDSAVPFYAYRFGRNLLGFHHGHKVKFDQLPALFADEYRSMHGETDRTYIHMGHYHHKQVKEVGKATVEMHRTLAARDAHASYGGYHSERATDAITYHKQYGEVGRVTVTPLMFEK